MQIGVRRRAIVVSALGLAFLLIAAAIGLALSGASGKGATSVVPRVGQDHWHARIAFYVCGAKQPNAPTWEGGVHTHGDGIIHIHPFNDFEEGRGARLVKWFEYGGGQLTADTIRWPGSQHSYTNGEPCNDFTLGVIHVYVNGDPVFDWSEYIPQDGDSIVIDFGPLP